MFTEWSWTECWALLSFLGAVWGLLRYLNNNLQ